MAELIAVVGPRAGGDLEAVDSFMSVLHYQQPDAIVVSGGAEGVDQRAENFWIHNGGTVWSFRIRKVADELYSIEKWIISPQGSQIIPLIGEPTWANASSALLYRSMLVAEVAGRVVAFHGPMRMRGTEFTTFISKEAELKPTYVHSDGQWASYNT